MLGRQQIAGVATALSELFKNGHDAYATRVEADYYRFRDLLVVRDNGFGMSFDDVNDRWLTLGTDSKASSLSRPKRPSNEKEDRPILGEKGIGRLAVAIVGPQTLMMTRAEAPSDSQHCVTAVFVNWGLFAIPGVNLEEVAISVRPLESGTLPDRGVIQEMVADTKGILETIVARRQQALVDAIEKAPVSRVEDLQSELKDLLDRKAVISEELDNFDVDPRKLDAYVPEMALINGTGTHFYISPVNRTVGNDLRQYEGGEVSDLVKLLIGFTNTMTPGHPEPVVDVKFRDHRSVGVFTNILDDADFFTESEFLSADHRFTGRFDLSGDFCGEVSIYGSEPSEYLLPWTRNRRNGPTACGPFEIALAYVQGNQRESKLPPDSWKRIGAKLDSFGGLYVYRNGVRVLPYGDSNFDWLDVEKRRTLGAGHYFFSYRRMFGAVLINREVNWTLAEKAGREGFQQNAAYREFREILMNFLICVASDFFREGGDDAEVFLRVKEELKRIDLARKKREKQAKKTRSGLQKQLDTWFGKIAGGEPESEVEQLIRQTRERVEYALRDSNIENATHDAIEQEAQARKGLIRLEAKYSVARPRGFGLTRKLEREYAGYEARRANLQKELFDAAASRIRSLVTEMSEKKGLALDKRIRTVSLLDDATNAFQKQLTNEAEGIRKDFMVVIGQVSGEAAECLAAFQASAKTIRDDFLQCPPDEINDFQEQSLLTALRRSFQVQLDQVRTLQSQLRYINSYFAEREDGVTIVDTTEALEEEVLELRRQLEVDLDRTQIGMAVEVVSHEFNKWVRALHHSVDDMAPFAAASAGFREPFNRLKDGLDHLWSYLSLLLPLMPESNVPPVEITGHEIAKFLGSVFRDSLSSESIDLEVTNSFDRKAVLAHRSTIYGAMINIMDNAIYWVSTQPSGHMRKVVLDASPDGFIISDSGPGIGLQEQEHIFDHGITSKPGGRGIGLAVARSSLRRDGFELKFRSAGPLSGATFAIVCEEPTR